MMKSSRVDCLLDTLTKEQNSVKDLRMIDHHFDQDQDGDYCDFDNDD